MRLSKSENHDPNYTAAIVECKQLREHSNADRLSVCAVFGNDCIVGRETAIGDIFIYFPLECQLSAKLASGANLFSDANLNADGKTKSYLEKNARIKAIRLRGERSAGFLMKVETFAEALKINTSDLIKKVGEEFDTIDGELVCNKYIAASQKQSGEPGEKRDKVEDKHSISKRLLPNQFRFHGQTSALGRNLHLLSPDSVISISEKLHGQNSVFSNVLVRPKYKLIDKVAKLFKAQIVEKQYQFLFSSRTVLKTRRDGTIGGNDQFAVHAKTLEGRLPAGISVISEVVGFTPGGAGIQKSYDYGCEPFQSKIKVFKITYTDAAGEVIDFDFLTMARFCEKYNLETVPLHYYGRAGDLFKGIDTNSSEWSNDFLKKLEETYLDKKCLICKNNVINEGIVLAIEDKINRPVLKFKSFQFLQKESKDRDSGVVEEN